MIEWLQRVVLGEIRELMSAARANYGVNPVIFLVIYLGSVPFFYYSIFRMVRALAKRLQNEVMIWSAVFLAATAAPFLYVLFFGRNLPWWVYLIIAALIGQGVYSLVRKLARKPPAPAQPPVSAKSKEAPKG
jgi:hypothetical protein